MSPIQHPIISSDLDLNSSDHTTNLQPSNSHKSPNLTSLPEHVLTHILTYLPTSSLARCTRLSRSFHEIALPCLYRDLDLTRHLPRLVFGDIDSVEQARSQRYSTSTNPHPHLVKRGLQHVRTIRLPGVLHYTPLFWREAISLLPRLDRVIIDANWLGWPGGDGYHRLFAVWHHRCRTLESESDEGRFRHRYRYESRVGEGLTLEIRSVSSPFAAAPIGLVNTDILQYVDRVELVLDECRPVYRSYSAHSDLDAGDGEGLVGLNTDDATGNTKQRWELPTRLMDTLVRHPDIQRLNLTLPCKMSVNSALIAPREMSVSYGLARWNVEDLGMDLARAVALWRGRDWMRVMIKDELKGTETLKALREAFTSASSDMSDDAVLWVDDV